MKAIYDHLKEAEAQLYRARLEWEEADDIAQDMWRIVYWAEKNQSDEELDRLYDCANKLQYVAADWEDRMDVLEEIVDALYKVDQLIAVL